MKKYLFLWLFLFIVIACDKGILFSPKSAHRLFYNTNKNVIGEEVIKGAASYSLEIGLGEMQTPIRAVLDMSLTGLMVREKDFFIDNLSLIGKNQFSINYLGQNLIGVLAKDFLSLNHSPKMRLGFSVFLGNKNIPNLLGLGYPDLANRPSDILQRPFMDQLQKYGYPNIFALALCGNSKKNSIHMGGFNPKIGLNHILKLEENSFSARILSVRMEHDKKELGRFINLKARFDVGSAFTILPSDVVKKMILEIQKSAQENGIDFPLEFYNTFKGASIKTYKFNHLYEMNRFPVFEIGFLGDDGQEKYLLLRPERYFKEMDVQDTFVRALGFRGSNDGDLILGQSFLENYYVLFDRGHGTVAFGKIEDICPY